MNILLVGHGAREHAIAARLTREGNRVFGFMARSNEGLRAVCRSVRLTTDGYRPGEILRFASEVSADLVFPCSETALFAGLADRCKDAGLACYGPRRAGAALESRKGWARERVRAIAPEYVVPGAMMVRASDLKAFCQHHGDALVVKPPSDSQKHGVVRIGRFPELIDRLRFPVLVEQYTPGVNFSLYFFMVEARPCFAGVVYDYPFKSPWSVEKTGGMGAFIAGTDTPWLSGAEFSRCRSLVEEVVRGLRKDGATPAGVLVAQFRKTSERIYFTEFDVRPGDPEMINVLYSLETSLTEVLFGREAPRMNDRCSVSIALAPIGYPRKTRTRSTHLSADCLASGGVYLGNTIRVRGDLLSASSRTLVVIGNSSDLETARCRALDLASRFGRGLYFRDDIARIGEHPELFYISGGQLGGTRRKQVYFTPIFPAPHCRYCNALDPVSFGARERRIVDIPFRGHPMRVSILVRRFRCRACNRTFYEKPQGVASTHGMTTRLVDWIRARAQVLPYTRIAKAVGVSEGTVRRICGPNQYRSNQPLGTTR